MHTLIGKKAPNFTASAAIGQEIIHDFSLENLLGKYVVLFFYPLDFTFVCPTELHAFQHALGEFHERNAEVLACSVDSAFCHHAWLKTPKNLGGIEGVSYPLISDINKQISRDYGVLSEEQGISFRGLFLIDKQGIIHHQIINNLPLGRDVNETLRILDALIYFEENGEVCPANWKAGKVAMQANHSGLEKYFAEH